MTLAEIAAALKEKSGATLASIVGAFNQAGREASPYAVEDPRSWGDIGEKALNVAMSVGPQAIAYHGSPHLFDKFDLSKIGTGEGAQAYGHGLYFADNPQVAKAYAGMSTGHLPKASDTAHVAAAQDAIAHGVNPHTVLRSAYPSATAQEIEAAVAEAKGGYKPNLYKVDIPDEAVANMLHWDKPLSEQPGKLQVSVVKNPEPHGSEQWLLQVGDQSLNAFPTRKAAQEAVASMTGADLWRWLEPKGANAARQFLLDRGIPGIRYLDQGSRGAGSGTYNTVLFDDSLAKIIGRE
jgi:hypothetical protein